MPATMDKLPQEQAHRVVKGFKREDLAELFAKKGYTVGAEIGVADGRYSLTLCQTIPNLRLLCVDPWEPYKGNSRGGGVEQQHKNYALALERLRPFNAVIMRMMSQEAARLISVGCLDFVFLDGNHDYDYISADLVSWAQKVRVGGVVAGHDFYRFGDNGVVRAVTEYTTSHRIEDWYICDERERSWWWVKH